MSDPETQPTFYLAIVPMGWQREETITEAVLGAARRAGYITTDEPFPFEVWACGPKAHVDGLGRLYAPAGETPPVRIKEGTVVREQNPEMAQAYDMTDAQLIARWGVDEDGDPNWPQEDYLYRMVTIADATDTPVEEG